MLRFFAQSNREVLVDFPEIRNTAVGAVSWRYVERSILDLLTLIYLIYM